MDQKFDSCNLSPGAGMEKSQHEEEETEKTKVSSSNVSLNRETVTETFSLISISGDEIQETDLIETN